jgi:hypothetical protein
MDSKDKIAALMGQQVANLYPVINGMVNIFNLTTRLPSQALRLTVPPVAH